MHERDKLLTTMIARSNNYASLEAIVSDLISQENKFAFFLSSPTPLLSATSLLPCHLHSDARFNKALIDNCQNDIDKYCRTDVNDNFEENDSEEPTADAGKAFARRSDGPIASCLRIDDENIQDHDMGGRIIACLRSKYADTQDQLNQKCITEIVDVIQASKLDIKFDVRLYQQCRAIINANCTGMDKEDCLKLIYQRKQITNLGCKAEVARIIREGQADINVDHTLVFACQADLVTHCNDVPIGQ